MMDAQVVYERDDGFDMKAGPFGYERVGFRIGSRVWWVGCTDSVSINKDFAEQVKLANEIVSRWNAAPSHG